MVCGAKTRAGSTCKNSPLVGGVGCRCKFHGGASISGKSHWNYKHGHCTKEMRLKTRESKDRLREIIDLGNAIGMFNKFPPFPRAK